MAALVAERLRDDAREAHLALERVAVLRRFGAGGQHRKAGRAVGERAQPHVDPGRRHVLDLDRDDARWQSLAAPAQALDQRAAGLVVEQQAGVAPARVAVGGEQRAHARAQLRHRRVLVGERARRAHRRARAAADAQVRLDTDVVAVGGDRLRRAHVDAQVAARLARAAVRADRRLVVEELGLLEVADRRSRSRRPRRPAPQRRFPAASSPAAAGASRTSALRPGRARGRSARCARVSLAIEVDGADRAAGDDALPVVAALVEIDLVAPVDRLLRADADARVAARADVEVDGIVLRPFDLERAEPSGGAARRAAVHGILALGGKLGPARVAGDQHRHRKLLLAGARPRAARRSPGRRSAAGLRTGIRHSAPAAARAARPSRAARRSSASPARTPPTSPRSRGCSRSGSCASCRRPRRRRRTGAPPACRRRSCRRRRCRRSAPAPSGRAGCAPAARRPWRARGPAPRRRAASSRCTSTGAASCRRGS